jgi:hypothetical protein
MATTYNESFKWVYAIVLLNSTLSGMVERTERRVTFFFLNYIILVPTGKKLHPCLNPSDFEQVSGFYRADMDTIFYPPAVWSGYFSSPTGVPWVPKFKHII